MRAAFGLDTPTAGSVHLKGEDVTGRRPAELIARGMFYMPPDRKNEGLVLGFHGGRNLTLGAFGRPLRRRFGILHRGRERATKRALAERVQLTARDLFRPAGLLS